MRLPSTSTANDIALTNLYQITFGIKSRMPSKSKHRKGHIKDRDKDGHKKFSCLSNPKHHECNGKWTRFRMASRAGRSAWQVKWATCRENEAVQFMKEEHGHTYDPDPPNEGDPKPWMRYSEIEKPSVKAFFYLSGWTGQDCKPARLASGEHNTRAQTANRHQKEHRRARPPMAPPVDEADKARVLQGRQEYARNTMTQEQEYDRTTQENDKKVEAWMAEKKARRTARSPNQSTVSPQGMTSTPMMRPPPATPSGEERKHRQHKSKHGPEPEPGPQMYATTPQDVPRPPGMAPVSMMSSPQDAFVEQQQMLSHHNLQSGQDPQPFTTMSPPQMMPIGMVSPMEPGMPPVIPPAQDANDGQLQMRHHHRHEFGQIPQPSATMPPQESLATAPAMLQDPVMSSDHVPSDGQRHERRRHHESSRELQPGKQSQPLSTMPSDPSMPAGMILPPGMDMPRNMPSAQGSRGEKHHRQRRGAGGQSDHEPGPPPPTKLLPPRTIRESAAILAEEALPAYPTQSMTARPRPQPPPGMPISPGIPPPSTRIMDLRSGAQVASGVSGHQNMQFPVGPPPAEPMSISATDMPTPPHPQNTRRAQRQVPQLPPSRMSSRASAAAASTAGSPGPQAMAVRFPPGALSGPPAIPPNSRNQPPPTSMPPFPGTRPGSTVSSVPSMRPPPRAPSPPQLLDEDD